MLENYTIDVMHLFDNIDVNKISDKETIPLSYIKCMDYGHVTNDLNDVITIELGEYICYTTKNNHGGWLAYVDVTNYPELHVFDFKLIDDVLPFHGGCTYSQWTNSIGKKKFGKEHYLIGCDWCHNTDWSSWKTITTFNKENLFGVEDVSFDNVLQNLYQVIEMMPEFRLKMTIRGNNV